MHNRILCLLLTVIAVMALCNFPKQATANSTEETFQPCYMDALIYQNAPNTNYGTINVLELYDNYGTAIRNVLNFNMTPIPSNAIIETATLSIYYKRLQAGIDPSGKQVGVYRLTQTAWTETGVTWNKYNGVNTWTTAGGDYITALANVTIHPSINNWMVFNVTDQVQYAITNTNAIAYFLFKWINENPASYSLTEYWSREYTTDTTLRPKLYVKYTIPPTEGWNKISTLHIDIDIKEWLKPSTFFVNVTLKTWMKPNVFFTNITLKTWIHIVTLIIKQSIIAVTDNTLLIILAFFVVFIVLVIFAKGKKRKH